jgi:hypothetical protein
MISTKEEIMSFVVKFIIVMELTTCKEFNSVIGLLLGCKVIGFELDLYP